MPHELERLADGSTAFATSRVPAWHQLGVVTTGCMTATEVITAARLGSCYADRWVMPSRCGAPTQRCSWG